MDLVTFKLHYATPNNTIPLVWYHCDDHHHGDGQEDGPQPVDVLFKY
jgi:hypothetical protein